MATVRYLSFPGYQIGTKNRGLCSFGARRTLLLQPAVSDQLQEIPSATGIFSETVILFRGSPLPSEIKTEGTGKAPG